MSNANYKLIIGDCIESMKQMPDNSVDSVVTDPPYGLGKEPDIVKVMRDWCDKGYHEIKGKGFMGKEWDAFVPQPIVWKEVMRVLKPGGHMLVACGTRTQDWMASSLRFAGFEIRDTIGYLYDRNPVMQALWDTLDGEQRKMLMRGLGNDSLAVQCYGSGFPKSQNVSKAIDKAAGAERERIGDYGQGFRSAGSGLEGWQREAHAVDKEITAPATEAAKQWDGWQTALKPAMELWTLARKPLGKGNTVAANVLKHGTGAINVDGCRVGTGVRTAEYNIGRNMKSGDGWNTHNVKSITKTTQGRYPANFCHDGSDEVVGLFPVTGASSGKPRNNGEFKSVAKGRDLPHVTHGHNDNGGSAARFFYAAKASKADRDEGNNHPTVKSTALMRNLCRLVTPPGGTVLDPFMGSGSTGKAAMLEGFNFIGCEKEQEYMTIAEARIEAAKQQTETVSPQTEMEFAT